MALKELWSNTGRWLRKNNPLAPVAHQPQIGDDGLISQSNNPAEQAVAESPGAEKQSQFRLVPFGLVPGKL